MSKEEQFEHIENKIRQAAESNQPAFDEKAWGKMKALLDKDEREPRPFFWLWFLLPLLLVGAGSAYLFYNYKNDHKNTPGSIVKISTTKKKSLTDLEKPQSENKQTTTENIAQLSIQQKNKESLANVVLIKEKQSVGDISSQSNDEQIKDITFYKNSKINKSKTKYSQAKTKIAVNDGEINQNKSDDNSEEINFKDKDGTKIKIPEIEPTDDAAIIEKEIVDKNIKTGTKKSDTDSTSVIAKNEKKPAVNTVQDKKSKLAKAKKKSSPFYLLGSFGADIGSVKLFSFSNSSVTAKYSIGVGYELNKKWSVQTGFYAGNKKYIAGPNDYHVKEHSYWSYYPITKVNASCMVYEIPITIRYNFLQKPSLIFYTTIGLSSYLMKKEDYNYYYMWNNVLKEKSISYTGNEHLFSTLSLSAGVEKKISSAFSLQFEPSVGLPLSGVGEGELKLFSTAVMIGIKYFPFKK